MVSVDKSDQVLLVMHPEASSVQANLDLEGGIQRKEASKPLNNNNYGESMNYSGGFTQLNTQYPCIKEKTHETESILGWEHNAHYAFNGQSEKRG